MIPVILDTIIMGGPTDPCVITLRPTNQSDSEKQIMPIWIGSNEAISISMAIEGIHRPRPITHDLTASIIQELGGVIEEVGINDVEGTTFFAYIKIRTDKGVKTIDARPSDAIALAVRTKAPIYVDKDVLEVASFPMLFGNRAFEEQVQIEEFEEFIDNVQPEDFAHWNSNPES